MRQWGGYNRTRGLNIVNWLLAPDANGNVNANARSMGVQQILFDDRCWNSDGDRGIASWNAMRECGVGHHDHVHIDLTLRGAAGTVGYWGATPSHRAEAGYAGALGSERELAPGDVLVEHALERRGRVTLPAGYDEAIVGDWDSDGTRDEIFLWDRDTGKWILQNWTKGDSLNARIGRLADEIRRAHPGRLGFRRALRRHDRVGP